MKLGSKLICPINSESQIFSPVLSISPAPQYINTSGILEDEEKNSLSIRLTVICKGALSLRKFSFSVYGPILGAYIKVTIDQAKLRIRIGHLNLKTKEFQYVSKNLSIEPMESF